MRLYDVAKGSLEELAGDYEAFLIGKREIPWAESNPAASRLASVVLDRYTGAFSRHDYGKYIIGMRERFAEFLEADNPIVAANSILIVIDEACKLLHRQMESLARTFREEGGFTERMSLPRLEAREAQLAEQDAPACPKCGKPMHKKYARRGRNAGNPFWACPAYPECDGTLDYDARRET